VTNGAAAGGGPSLRILPDPIAAATAAAQAIAETLGDAIIERGRAHWATTGGSAAVPMYQALGRDPLRADVAWAGVQLWWGDDRFVPHDHPLSNVLPVDEILLAEDRGVAIPSENVHPIPTVEAIEAARDAAWCAARYETDLRELGPAAGDDGLPVFDLIVLGVGGDGHILSVFPDSAVWDATSLTAAVPAPTHIEPHVERVTLHPSLVRVARRVIVIATGASKVGALQAAWSPGSEREIPARIAVRDDAMWFVDQAAAGGLRR
jgi:6-phosphogluconolactonase